MTYMPLADLLVFVALIVLGAVLVVMAWRYRKAKAANRNASPAILSTVSALAIILSTFLVVREFQQRASYRYDPAADQALGRALAELFVGNDMRDGDVVILSWGIPADEGMPVNRMAQTRLESLIQALEARGEPTPLVVSPAELIRSTRQFDDNDSHFLLEDFWFVDGGLPHWVLSAMWDKYPDARIFISLEGMPYEQFAQLKAAKPADSRFYALDLFGHNYEAIALADSPMNGVVVHRIANVHPVSEENQVNGLPENFLFIQQ
jgi:hypothetical protein